jgi:hypothetical protein
MNTIIKNKQPIGTVDDYINSISIKYEEQICNITKIDKKDKIDKIDKKNISIPTINNYEEITRYNYNVQQLKSFAKMYKLKVSGNKPQLISRIFIFLLYGFLILFLSLFDLKIKWFIEAKSNP